MIFLEKTPDRPWSSIIEEVEQSLAEGKKVTATLENGKTIAICKIAREGYANINEPLISFCIS